MHQWHPYFSLYKYHSNRNNSRLIITPVASRSSLMCSNRSIKIRSKIYRSLQNSSLNNSQLFSSSSSSRVCNSSNIPKKCKLSMWSKEMLREESERFQTPKAQSARLPLAFKNNRRIKHQIMQLEQINSNKTWPPPSWNFNRKKTVAVCCKRSEAKKIY